MDPFASLHLRALALLGRLSAAGHLPPDIDLGRCGTVPAPTGMPADLVLDAALVHARDAAAAGTGTPWLAAALAADLASDPGVAEAEARPSGLVAVTLRREVRFGIVASILREGAPDGPSSDLPAPALPDEVVIAPTAPLGEARAAVLAQLSTAIAVAGSGTAAPGRPGRRTPGPCGKVTASRRDASVGPQARSRASLTYGEVVAAIGRDAFRVAVAARRPAAPLDLDLAVLADRSWANPAFRLAYAHARFRAVLRRAALALPDDDLHPSALAGAELSSLTDPGEDALARLLGRHRHVLASADAAGQPNRFLAHLSALADAMHSQWSRSKDQPQLRFVNEQQRYSTKARLALVMASTVVLKSGLGILGVTAPDEMC